MHVSKFVSGRLDVRKNAIGLDSETVESLVNLLDKKTVLRSIITDYQRNCSTILKLRLKGNIFSPVNYCTTKKSDRRRTKWETIYSERKKQKSSYVYLMVC